MTVSTQQNIATYTGNGTSTVFAVPYYFILATHLFVTKITISTGARTLMVLGVDYNVTGAGVLTGGQITTLGTPLSNLFQIEIKRKVPIVQLVDYVPHSGFDADTTETALDWLTMICQDLDQRLGLLEVLGFGGTITIQNLGTGTGLYASQSGSLYKFMSIKGHADGSIVLTNDGATITIRSTGGAGVPAFPNDPSLFLRGDGTWSDTIYNTSPSDGLGLRVRSDGVGGFPAAIYFDDEGAATNEKTWFFGEYALGGGSFQIGTKADLLVTGGNPALVMSRSGITPTYTQVLTRVGVGSNTIDDGATGLRVNPAAVFTYAAEFTGRTQVLGGDFYVQASGVQNSWLNNTALGVDLKNWAWSHDGALKLSAWNDALNASAVAFQVNRSGAAIASLELKGRVRVNGQADDGATALQVAGTATFTTPLAIASGGTSGATQQAAIDALTNVGAAIAGYVLTKDGSNHATFQAPTGTQPYIVPAEFSGLLTASLVLREHVFTETVTFPSGLTGSTGIAETPAVAQADIDIRKSTDNGQTFASVGTIRYAIGSRTATFIMSSQTVFSPGHVVKLVCPNPADTALATIAVALRGTR